MSQGAQNMKTGPDALGTAENESERAKHENGTRHPRYRGKRLWEPTPSIPLKISSSAQNMKTGPDALRTAKNESHRAKHEDGTGRPRDRRK
jgi:hypothetical protein